MLTALPQYMDEIMHMEIAKVQLTVWPNCHLIKVIINVVEQQSSRIGNYKLPLEMTNHFITKYRQLG